MRGRILGLLLRLAAHRRKQGNRRERRLADTGDDLRASGDAPFGERFRGGDDGAADTLPISNHFPGDYDRGAFRPQGGRFSGKDTSGYFLSCASRRRREPSHRDADVETARSRSRSFHFQRP